MDTDKRNKILLFVAGTLLGMSAFLLLYGFSPLDVTNDVFLRGGYIEQDIRQHYAGWLYYRNSPLHIPFCIVPDINWPEGMSIAFTDSIPLFAVFFRLIEPILPSVFQYFGWFTLLCFMLQGGFASLLMQLFTKRNIFVVLGVIPFVFSPILIERAFRHTSLAAQFLILAALYYYLLSHRQNKFAYKGLFLVNCISITIHPYFVPMTFAITFALLAEYCFRNYCFAKPFVWLIANLSGSLFTGWLFGFFSSSGSGAGGSGVEYGYFGMNLNALWNPVSRGDIIWSRILPIQNQVNGNYDAFNYLGFGILFALIITCCIFIIFNWRRLPHFICLNGGMIFVSLCLTVFAVTHIITANGATLAVLPFPHALIQLCTVLRSSGRMFWPVYYVLMLIAVWGVLRISQSIRGKHTCMLSLALLCLVQLFDLSPALMQKVDSMRHYIPAVPDIVTDTTPELCNTSNFFSLVSGKYERLAALDQLTYTGISLALYTADEKMQNTDTSFFARYNEAAAAAQRTEALNGLQQGLVPANTLFVTEDEATFLSVADTCASSGAWCGSLEAELPEGQKTVLYVIAPCFNGEGISLSKHFDSSFPVHLPSYSDDYWDNGVLSFNLDKIDRTDSKNKVVLFSDTPFIRDKLASSASIICEGRPYEILDIDDSDPGWLMLTLDISDAHILVGKDLTFSS